MPLKHPTETFLIFLLGVVTAAIGLLTATLPPLPDGGLPWGILAAIACVYPLSLSRLFKRNRADHAFRLLHWLPLLILVLWMLLELLGWFVPTAQGLSALFTWGWTIGAVAVTFVLIGLFCLHVIRRRGSRLALLAVAFVPFLSGAVASETGYEWEKEIASVLWDNSFIMALEDGFTGTGTQMAHELEEDKNLDESEDSAEEEWRERLRAFERRRQRIAARLSDNDEDTLTIAQSPVPTSDTGTGMEYREISQPPSVLPQSGGPLATAGLTMITMYCGVLHHRVRRRTSSAV